MLISGFTVMAAMAGMFLAGNGVFSGIALATILVVATAIIGSLTVLPALLAPKSAGFLARIPGAGFMGRGFRFVGRGIAAAWAFVTWPFRTLQSLLRRGRGERTIWNRILTPVLRHPVISVVASAAVLVALAIPAADLKLGLANRADYGMSREPARDAGEGLDRQGLPRLALARGHRDRGQGRDDAAGQGRDRELRADRDRERPRFPPVHPPAVSQDHTVARLYVPIKGDDHDAEAVRSMKAPYATPIVRRRSTRRAGDRRPRSPARLPARRTSAR